jgi:hypothetical protein
MTLLSFLRSWRGRLLRIALGCALLFSGATMSSLPGVVLMMVGVVPIVMGLSGICVVEEILTMRHRARPGSQPREPLVRRDAA